MLWVSLTRVQQDPLSFLQRNKNLISLRPMKMFKRYHSEKYISSFHGKTPNIYQNVSPTILKRSRNWTYPSSFTPMCSNFTFSVSLSEFWPSKKLINKVVRFEYIFGTTDSFWTIQNESKITPTRMKAFLLQLQKLATEKWNTKISN